jgi:ABC-type sulfate transport system permease component
MRVSRVATQFMGMRMTVVVGMARVPLRSNIRALVRLPFAVVVIVGVHLLLLYLSLGPASRWSPACWAV